MSEMLRVSVIIPVYNVASYVTQAVESALAEPEAAEVILVEDGSPDNSLSVCEQLAIQHDRVTLYRHPSGANRGAGASRNLGIRRSACPYIAFLDADDTYLPGRFDAARHLFEGNPHIDGVYGATGVHFESEAARQGWAVMKGPDWSGLTTMEADIAPDTLFEALISGERGVFHTNAITAKREALEHCGLFDTHLRLHQDTAMWLRLAATATLVGGQLDQPVALRRVHDSNRISAERDVWERQRHQLLMWHTLHGWARRHLDADRQRLVVQAYLKALLRPYHRMPYGVRQMRVVLRLLTWTLRRPALLRSSIYRHELVLRLLAYTGLRRLLAALRLLPDTVER